MGLCELYNPDGNRILWNIRKAWWLAPIIIMLLLVALFFSSGQIINASDNNLTEVLILSGKNNHKWQLTTPAIQKILEESGRFNVTITNSPENIDPSELQER